MLRLILAGACAALLAVGVLVGCGGSDGDGSDEVSIGVVLKNLASPFWQQAEMGVNAAAKEGVSVEVTAVKSEIDVAEQIDKVENELAKGVDALVVAPTVPEELEPVLVRAAGEDVPVIVLDTDLPDFEEKTAYVGTDNVEAGEIAGKYIDEQLEGKGSLGILVALPGVTSVDEREAGVQDALDPGIEVFTSEKTECVTEKGVTATENLLTAHPDVSALFGSCGESLLGGAIAIKADGREGDIVTVSVDATPETLEQLETGELSAVIAQYPAKMGFLGVEAAVEAAEGKEVESFVNSGVSLVTKANRAKVEKELLDPEAP